MPAKKTPKAPTVSLALTPSSGLDQPLRVADIKTLLDEIDTTVAYAADHQDSQMAFDLVERFAKMNQMVGLGLAKILWLMQARWQVFGAGLDSFEDEIYRRVGKAPDTVRRYIGAWELMADLNEYVAGDIQETLMARPIADLIAIAQTSREHGRLSVDKIRKLAQAEDSAAVRKLLRKYTGREDSEPMTIELEADGTLKAWQGESDPVVVGYLRCKPNDLKDELRAKAVARIKRRLGLLEEAHDD